MVAAGAGAVGLAAVLVWLLIDGPFGLINELAGVVMIAALAPVMLAHYELGGPVPLWPARLSLAGGIVAAIGWAAFQTAFAAGLLDGDGSQPAPGWQIQAGLQVVIGLWIAGASFFAGQWLPTAVRALGIIAGLGVLIMAIGLLLGDVGDVRVLIGWVGYQIVLPVWAFRLGRVFRSHAEAEPWSRPEPGAAPA
jgi:hypothetical protein